MKTTKAKMDCTFMVGFDQNWDMAYLFLINGRVSQEYPAKSFTRDEARAYARREFHAIAHENKYASWHEVMPSVQRNIDKVPAILSTTNALLNSRNTQLTRRAAAMSLQDHFRLMAKKADSFDDTVHLFQKALILMHQVNIADSRARAKDTNENLKALDTALLEMKNFMLRKGAEHMKCPDVYHKQTEIPSITLN